MAEEIFAEEMMAEKPVARGREIPPGRTIPDQSPGAFMNTQSLPVGPDEVDNLPQPTPEEENQIDIFLGGLKDFIWDDGYNSIVAKLKKGQSKIPETVGEIAGRMVKKEVKASDDANNSVSRDILYGIGAEVVNELFEVAHQEGLYVTSNEQEQQADQGDALIAAVQKYGDSWGKEGDPMMDEKGVMQTAASVLRGGYPEAQVAQKMGIQMTPEMGGANGELG